MEEGAGLGVAVEHEEFEGLARGVGSHGWRWCCGREYVVVDGMGGFSDGDFGKRSPREVR